MLRYIFGLVVCVNFVFSAKLPETFKTCNRNSADFDDCLKNELQNTIRQLGKSFSAVGLHSFEPLEVSEMSIGEGKGTVNVIQNYKNVKLYGLTKINIDKAHMDYDNKVFTASGKAAEIKQEADYDFNGRVLLLPIVGVGKSTLKLVNVGVTIEIKMEEVMKKGKKYYVPTSCDIKLVDPELVVFDFENLFNGNKQLGDNILKVLNENWKEVYADVAHGYEAAYSEIVLQESKNLFSRVPIDDIFPSA